MTVPVTTKDEKGTEINGSVAMSCDPFQGRPYRKSSQVILKRGPRQDSRQQSISTPNNVLVFIDLPVNPT